MLAFIGATFAMSQIAAMFVAIAWGWKLAMQIARRALKTLKLL